MKEKEAVKVAVKAPSNKVNQYLKKQEKLQSPESKVKRAFNDAKRITNRITKLVAEQAASFNQIAFASRIEGLQIQLSIAVNKH